MPDQSTSPALGVGKDHFSHGNLPGSNRTPCMVTEHFFTERHSHMDCSRPLNHSCSLRGVNTYSYIINSLPIHLEF
jgi:hypothetical protein